MADMIPWRPDSEHSTSIESSREVAVGRVLRGGLAALAGAAVTGAMSFLQASSGLPFALGMGGFVLAGLGLVEVGRATGHFLRFGTLASRLGFVAAAGLGASAVLAGLSNWIGVTLGGAVWVGVVHWSMNGVYGFGTIVALLALRALARWVIEVADLAGGPVR